MKIDSNENGTRPAVALSIADGNKRRRTDGEVDNHTHSRLCRRKRRFKHDDDGKRVKTKIREKRDKLICRNNRVPFFFFFFFFSFIPSCRIGGLVDGCCYWAIIAVQDDLQVIKWIAHTVTNRSPLIVVNMGNAIRSNLLLFLQLLLFFDCWHQIPAKKQRIKLNNCFVRCVCLINGDGLCFVGGQVREKFFWSSVESGIV